MTRHTAKSFQRWLFGEIFFKHWNAKGLELPEGAEWGIGRCVSLKSLQLPLEKRRGSHRQPSAAIGSMRGAKCRVRSSSGVRCRGRPGEIFSSSDSSGVAGSLSVSGNKYFAVSSLMGGNSICLSRDQAPH